MRPLDFLADRLPSGGSARPVTIDVDRACHILVVGGSGSGKSIVSMLISAKIGLHIPDAKMWILDFKGDDTFAFLRNVDGARYAQHTGCMVLLEDFYTMFKARLSGDPDRSFRLLWVEEVDTTDELGNHHKKAIAKGARLYFYPAGFHLYRFSRGIKRPEVCQTTEVEAQEIIGDIPLTYVKTISITDGAGEVKNIINYRQYERGKKQEGITG